jgi:hypothetical protein
MDQIKMSYKARHDTECVFRNSDNAIIGPENEEEWNEYQTWLAEGNTTEPADPLPIFVPGKISMWQLRAVLDIHGLLDDANNIVNSSGDKTLKAVWEYGNFANRNSNTIVNIAKELKLSDKEVDDMFIEADSLSV